MDAAAHLAFLPLATVAALQKRYGEPHRAYHTWAHIEELFERYEEFAGLVEDATAVRVALAYHDAIYDPMRTDNELRSADLMRSECTTLVDERSLTAASGMIEATVGHTPPTPYGHAMSDALHFLDADLSILGAAPERFDAYEEQVRAEYAFVPADAFTVGRRGVLQRFLDRPALYFTEWGRARFEAQARANLARAMTRVWR